MVILSKERGVETIKTKCYDMNESELKDLYELENKTAWKSINRAIHLAGYSPTDIFHWSRWGRVDVDSFTVPLHTPDDRHLPVIRAVQRAVTGVWKTLGIPTGHMSP